jgi:hypothetical protein
MALSIKTNNLLTFKLLLLRPLRKGHGGMKESSCNPSEQYWGKKK